MNQPSRVGSEIGGYRLESVLGRGGMSVIYLAEQVRLGRRVALKLLAAELAEDERFRERFLRESQLASTIEHPNIIPIYDAGEDDGCLYIAMRYVAGPSLKELIKRDGALGVGRVLYIVEQVASALDVAHRSGLVHRDVKPANILLEEASEHAFLSDFGVAKQTTARGMTSTGLFLGTIEYSSPEQIEGRPVDARTDIYGLGCVLVESLTGAPPFEHESEVAMIHAHLSTPPPMLSARRPDLPLGLNGVVARALAKDPNERYQSAGDLVLALREGAQRASAPHRAVVPEPAAASSTETVASAPAADTVASVPTAEPVASAPAVVASSPAGETVAAPPPRRRSWRLLALAAAALVVVGGAGAAISMVIGGGAKHASAGTSSSGAASAVGSGDTASMNGGASTHDAMGTDTHAAGSGMEMHAGKGNPRRRLATFVGSQPTWQCSHVAATTGALEALTCSTKVPEMLRIQIFKSRRALDAAYAALLRRAHAPARDTGACRADSWGGEQRWFHGEGEPGGRVFCHLNSAAVSSRVVWTSTVGVPTLYDATYDSLDHRHLYFWWAGVRHELF